MYLGYWGVNFCEVNRNSWVKLDFDFLIFVECLVLNSEGVVFCLNLFVVIKFMFFI